MTKLSLSAIALGLLACVAPSQPGDSKGPQPRQQTDSRLRRIADVPSGLHSYQLHCVSASVCWVGDYMNQWVTNDAGQHWELIYSGDSGDRQINTVEYLDTEVAWILTLKKLLKTVDGGRNWIEQPSPLPAYPIGELRTIKFLKGGKIGWAGGGVYRPLTKGEERSGTPPSISDPQSHKVLRPAVFYTEDGGKTWASQSIPDDLGRISGFTFLNDRQGLAFGSSGPLFTTNGGRQWKFVDFNKSCTDEKYLEGYDMQPVDVSFLDSENAWLLFEDGRITRSTDGGRSWCDLLAPTMAKFSSDRSYLRQLHFLDLSHGFALAANGFLYETSDGGKTWAKALDSQFDDIFFLDAKTGWLISKAGLFQILT